MLRQCMRNINIILETSISTTKYYFILVISVRTESSHVQVILCSLMPSADNYIHLAHVPSSGRNYMLTIVIIPFDRP